MIVNLIKSNEMFSITLPEKVKGQYWIKDLDDNGKSRQIISIEAVDERWVVKSNKLVSFVASDGNEVKSFTLDDNMFYYLKIKGTNEKALLSTEAIEETRQTLKKVVSLHPDSYTIGKSADNNICFDNSFVSGHHAVLSFDGTSWAILDENSTNGTYVNGYRIRNQVLKPGDYIYIIGLKIIVGKDFIAINNPDGKVKIKSESLGVYKRQEISANAGQELEIPEKSFFFRSPRFHREIKNEVIKIDPPPQRQTDDGTPIAMVLGPSLTMGTTAVFTGLFTVFNVIANGGEIRQAIPSLIMAIGMMFGTLIWPVITKTHEKNRKEKREFDRQNKYQVYLKNLSQKFRHIGKKQSEILYENMICQDDCANRILNRSTNLWERVIGQGDFLNLRLGIGDLPMDVKVEYQEKKFSLDEDNLQDLMLELAEEPKVLTSVPISLNVTENPVIGIYGDLNQTENMIKGWLLQMFALHSYDELKIMLIADEDEAKHFDFVKFIPHLWSDDKTTRFFATNQEEVKELSAYIEKNIIPRKQERDTVLSPYYVIICLNRSLPKKCEALQQLLKEEEKHGVSLIYSALELKDLPKEAKTIINANDTYSCMYDKDDTSGERTIFAVDRAYTELIDEIAYTLANTELDIAEQNYILPSMLTFLEMFGVSKVEHLNSLTRWRENTATKSLQTPVGVDIYGDSFKLDLHEKFHGPHGLVAGMTGSGKSEFIITYILSLAVNYHPDEVSFILIDYKGGGLAGAFEDKERGIKLPHLAGTITNLDGAAVTRSLISIQSELRRRQAIFNKARKISNEGTMDIYKYQQLYRDKVVDEPVPHLFIISDEFAELKAQQPEFMDQLISTARIGRSLGVHLILATQKPNGVVNDQIWSNSKFRVCLKVQDKADSMDMIKRIDAAELSQTGRFYLQVGFNELFALGQSAWCGAEYQPTETVEKKKDSSVQVIDNIGHTTMNVNPDIKKINTGSKVKQIVAIVKYLSDLAVEENVSVRPLWLEPISPDIFIDNLETKYGVSSRGTVLNPIVGEYDDPFNQRQDVLTVPFTSEGNCLLYGAPGNGKSTFVSSVIYSLIKNHTPEEVNMYIMDFGSETLRMFEKAPHVGGVITSADEEKTVNLFKMLETELEKRKALFSDFGGDYQSYCRSGKEKLPNIVVFIHNFSNFIEQYDEMGDTFSILARDGVKYGIYFMVTATGVGAVRYRYQQNFKTMLTLQLNDASDYSMVVGKTEGVLPSKFRGRGLVNQGKVYEFQTARATPAEDSMEFIRNYCKKLAEGTELRAKQIPTLPAKVTYEYVAPYITNLRNIPVGINKADLSVAGVSLEGRVIFPVASQDVHDCTGFASAMYRLCSKLAETRLLDFAQLLTDEEVNFSEEVRALFDEMVLRNNTYKDAGMDVESLKDFSHRVYVITGIGNLINSLSPEDKDKLVTLLEKAEVIYKIHFVLIDSLARFNESQYEPWFKKHISSTEGIWVGDGVVDQYLVRPSKVTREMYEEIGSDYAYLVSRGRSSLIKIINDNNYGEV